MKPTGSRTFEVLLAFLRLGLTSFGGPVAHLGYFHDEFIRKRKWLDEHTYADLVALCQFLPGPASSQVGLSIGFSRAGILGAIAAWIGFTLPSALLLAAFGMGIARYHGDLPAGWLHGLKLAAVPIVANALWGMGKKLCHERVRASIAVVGAIIVLLLPAGFAQITVIAIGAFIGWRLLEDSRELPRAPLEIGHSRTFAAALLIVLAALLVGLPILARSTDVQEIKLFDSFFRAGSLVFGGGHVVLPLLKAEVVNTGWVSADHFMAGYGAAQAVPGPLFTFSAYLGAVSTVPPSGWAGAGLCLIAAFLPSFFLVLGVLPFWEKLRGLTAMRSALQGVNAAVVGLLLAAFYNPVWSSAILAPRDFALALLLFLLLTFWRTPSWAIVLISACISGLI